MSILQQHPGSSRVWTLGQKIDKNRQSNLGLDKSRLMGLNL